MACGAVGTASKSKHGLVKRLGATPIDYKGEDFVERIRSLTGDGVDAAFDPIGGGHFKRSFSVLRRIQMAWPTDFLG